MSTLFSDADDFIAWENEQAMRYELVGGVVRLMAGGSADHDLISANLIGAIRERLRGGPCRAHGSNLKVRSTVAAVMYPDMFVRCSPHQGQVTAVDDPVLVAEVLSPRTQQDDLTRKRWAYQAIPSLRVILLVETERPLVELATRDQEGTWRSQLIEGLEESLPLDALGTSLPLAEIFEGVTFGEPSPEDQLLA